MCALKSPSRDTDMKALTCSLALFHLYQDVPIRLLTRQKYIDATRSYKFRATGSFDRFTLKLRGTGAVLEQVSKLSAFPI